MNMEQARCTGGEESIVELRIAGHPVTLSFDAEVQFGQEVSRHWVTLLRRLLEPVPGVYRVRDQQRTVPPERLYSVIQAVKSCFLTKS